MQHQGFIFATYGNKHLEVNPVRDQIIFCESLGLHRACVTRVDPVDDDTSPVIVITSTKPGHEAAVLYDSDSKQVLRMLNLDIMKLSPDAVLYWADGIIETLRWRIGKGQAFKDAIREMFPKTIERFF